MAVVGKWHLGLVMVMLIGMALYRPSTILFLIIALIPATGDRAKGNVEQDRVD